MIRRLVLAVALLIFATAVPVSAATRTVEAVDFAFQPAGRTVAMGDFVRWHNGGDFNHTSTARQFNLWNRTMAPGATSVGVAFQRAGKFAYWCTIHTNMTGSVSVPMRSTPGSGTLATNFTIRVANVNAPSGYTQQIQMRKKGGTFAQWRNVTGQTTTFSPSSKAVWQFRSRLRRLSDGTATGWSPVLSITVS